MCSEQSFDNHDSFYVPSLAMVQLTWDTTAPTDSSEYDLQVVCQLLTPHGICDRHVACPNQRLTFT